MSHPKRCETCGNFISAYTKCKLEVYGEYEVSHEPAYRNIPETVIEWNTLHGCSSHILKQDPDNELEELGNQDVSPEEWKAYLKWGEQCNEAAQRQWLAEHDEKIARNVRNDVIVELIESFFLDPVGRKTKDRGNNHEKEKKYQY
jgi:hypothetical protein